MATRLPALWMNGRSRYTLGEFEHSLRDLGCGASIAADTGRLTVRLLLTLESVGPLIQLGRIGDAISTAEDGLEIARLSGIPRVLVWAHAALASAQLAAGDVAAALRHANAADLAEAQLACGDAGGAEAMLVKGRKLAARSGVAWSAAVTDLGWAALHLARGKPEQALDAAAAACEIISSAPLLGARASVAQGKALGATGARRSAIETLVIAERELDSFDALRSRDEAVRELRAPGHRVLRPARESRAGAIGPLTSREAERAELVAAGRPIERSPSSSC